ncbi:MAG: nickel pincer cofactor biosynthesis protein LarC [Spirochaetes bacterium]|nr:nickel pincer cofactor biosynthesis protein LarC [Spirochaetota bacterium]
MKAACFDCFAGVSGDMIVGSLIDAGLDMGDLKKMVGTLPLEGYDISAERVVKSGIAATRFSVTVRDETPPRRGLAYIRKILETSGLPEPVKSNAASIFGEIARVEAAIHGTTIEEVHFHEIGAIDSIIDVTAACAALHLMDIDEVRATRVNVGEGFIENAHGTLPVPAPATAALLVGAPVYSSGIPAELATPTGAAILARFVKRWGPLPEMRLDAVGYGAGTRDLAIPNLLRVFIGEIDATASYETILSIETNIDDMNPEFYQHVFESLLESGALDVYTTPIIMKKSRPGVMLTVLAREEDRDALARIVFAETTTAGVRIARLDRLVLQRETRRVSTVYGEIGVKVLSSGDRPVTISPEFEDCRAAAKTLGVPLRKVYDEARKRADFLLKE